MGDLMTNLSDADLAEIEAVAKAAHIEGVPWHGLGSIMLSDADFTDAAHIARMDPATTLALLAELTRDRDALARVRYDAERVLAVEMGNYPTPALGAFATHCETCGHTFDAASEADRFACGEDCTGKHVGDDDGPAERLLRAIFGEQGRPPMTTHPAPNTPPETRSRAGDTEEDDRE